MEIKVLGIHSSPHNGATAAALRYALQAVASLTEVETEFVELRKGKCNPCIHCDRCIKEKLYYCPVYDDAISPLYEKIRTADVIMLASPVLSLIHI